MEIGNAENGGEAYSIAGGVAGNAGVVVFKRTDDGMGLKEVARNTDDEVDIRLAVTLKERSVGQLLV